MLSRNESLSKTENEQRVQRALLAVIKFRATVHVYRLSRIILVLYSPRTTAPRIIFTVAASLSLVFGMYWPSCDCFLFASEVRNQNFISRKWNMRLKLCLVSTAGEGLGWKFVCNPSPLVLLNHHLSWSHHFLVSNDSLRIFHCFLPFFLSD